jgi:hypothetical protein
MADDVKATDETDGGAATGAATGDANATAQAKDTGQAVAATDTKTADAKAADAKSADGKAADAKPAAVDYGAAIKSAMPEGVTYDEKVSAQVGEVFTKHNIPEAAVADLINLHAAQLKAGADGNAAAFAAQVAAWKTESSADKELGAENMGIAKVAASKAFDTKTVELMEHFGLMNHPGVLKGLVKIGKAIKDDTFVTGDAGSMNGSRDARAHFPASNMNP